MKNLGLSEFVNAVLALSMLSLLLIVPLAHAATYVYPWHGYPYYNTDIGVSVGDGESRIAPYNDAWSVCDYTGREIWWAESIHGVGADIYSPGDIDIIVWIRGTYHLTGWVASLGYASCTSAISIYIIDHCHGDTIVASALLRQQIRWGMGSYDESGNLNISPSLYASLLGGHEYYALGVARTSVSNIVVATAYAYASLDLTLLQISVYPWGYLSSECPNLLVWTGHEYADEGVLSIHNRIDPEADIVRNHKLMSTPARVLGSCYKMKLSEIAREYNYSHSYIDYVSLVAVDAEGRLHETQLISAYHSRDGNVISQLLTSDNFWAQTFKGDEITLVFRLPTSRLRISTWLFTIEGHNPMKN